MTRPGSPNVPTSIHLLRLLIERVFDTIVLMFEEQLAELVTMTDDELRARIDALELERRRLDAQMSAAVAVADSRNLHGAGGHRTMTAFCRSRLNWSTAESRRRLSLARAVDQVPGLGDAWLTGHIGFPQAMKLAMANGNERVAHALVEFAPMLLDHAEKMPYSDFADTIDHFVSRADEDGAHDDRDAAIEGRSAQVVSVGGLLDMRATGGDGLTAAEMTAIFQRFVDSEFRTDVEARRAEHGELADSFSLARTDAQRRFDALVALFRSAATAAEPGAPAATVVNVVVDADTWGRMLASNGLSTTNRIDGTSIDPFTGLPVDDTAAVLGTVASRCETSTGVALHPHDVLRAALAGHVRRVVVDTASVVIDMGRQQRLFTGSARTAAKLLIKRCERTGCELPGDWSDVDHIDEWQRDEGSTDQRNGAILCHHDNNDKHHKRWRTKRATNGSSYTIDHNGNLMLPVGARPPAFA